jgi:hypothetical protein
MRTKGQPKPGNVSEHHSREGQAWSQTRVHVFDNEQYRTTNPKGMGLPFDHFMCRECHIIVEVDARGFAFCVSCGTIYNDGKPPFHKIKSKEAKDILERKRKTAFKRMCRC